MINMGRSNLPAPCRTGRGAFAALCALVLAASLTPVPAYAEREGFDAVAAGGAPPGWTTLLTGSGATLMGGLEGSATGNVAGNVAGNAAISGIDDLDASYQFLVRRRGDGGVVFRLSAADGGHALPASFLDTADYWGTYVCRMPGNACAVTDTYDPATSQLNPEPGPAGALQTERVNVHNGANIYDAAAWQIAVMLGHVRNHFAVPAGHSAYSLAGNLNRLHRKSGRGPRAGAAPGTMRAVTVGNTFIYNGAVITDSKSAYAFRAVAPAWLASDPLMGTRHAALITAKELPAANPEYQAGKITWSDWKPITGENAWAFLIGPLQAAYLHHVVGEQQPAIPFDDLAIQNALDVLPTFAAMQSAVGAVAYAPSGTIGNEGDQPINPHEVSVENNLSLYAGLRILGSTLRATLRAGGSGQDPLTENDRARIDGALRLIDLMIDGAPGDGPAPRAGLSAFLRNAAWQNGAFVQGGLAGDPAQGRDWVPSSGPRAVDVQTWGIAALGAHQIDQWFGDGAAFRLWQDVKTWGATGVGQTLWGVGFSDRDGNGMDRSGTYRQGVMSAEWTAGAITAVRNMIGYYGAAAAANEQYLAVLRADEAAMLRAIHLLRLDRYQGADFPGQPDNYGALMAVGTKPYLYASRRHHIPFGWVAIPLPSTAATAWMIMLANSYDPFGYGGAAN